MLSASASAFLTRSSHRCCRGLGPTRTRSIRPLHLHLHPRGHIHIHTRRRRSSNSLEACQHHRLVGMISGSGSGSGSPPRTDVRRMSSGAGGAVAAADDDDYGDWHYKDAPPRRRLEGTSEEPEPCYRSSPPMPPIVQLRSARPGYYHPGNDDDLDDDDDRDLDSDDFPPPPPSFRTGPIDLTVRHPSAGGHVVLGRNGLGKTLLARMLVSGGGRQYVRGENENGDDEGDGNGDGDGSIEFMEGCVVSHVSFESHRDLLDRRGADATVYRTIAGAGNLNKAAQFLVVRFGLYPFLHRDVSTLSTGEIRKVMIVRALSVRPDLLVLDNVFDGLDVPSREKLKDLVSRTLRGFRPDILVQGVTAKAAQHTQVVMATHRPEEIVPEVTTVSYMYRQRQRQRQRDVGAATTSTARLRTEPRGDMTGEELVALALRGDDEDRGGDEPKRNGASSVAASLITDDTDVVDRCLPSPDQIEAWWWRGRDRDIGTVTSNSSIGGPSESESGSESKNVVDAIRAKDLSIHLGNATPVRDVNWTVRRGEHWLVAGRNGSGKSTLSRLLARRDWEEGEEEEKEKAATLRGTTGAQTGTTTTVGGSLHVLRGDDDDDHHARGRGGGGGPNERQHRRDGVGWVSTELHMELARCDASARNILTRGGDTPEEIADAVVEWIGLGLLDDIDVDVTEDYPAQNVTRARARQLLSRPFSTLSQGEQRLVLFASAIASRPDVLVLDEPCHGLDLVNRGRVLGLIERLCLAKGTGLSLVYITHHLEEVIPSITHVLHLRNGEAVFRGTREEYRPDEIQED